MNPRAGVVFATVALAACGDAGVAPPPAQSYTDPGFVETGGVRLHYALTPTRDLPSEIAGSYGIEQRPNLALLTIRPVSRDARVSPHADAFTVEASAVTLTGLRSPLALRRVDETGGPTWLATVVVRHREPVTIEIRAHAVNGPEITARWTREFHLD